MSDLRTWHIIVGPGYIDTVKRTAKSKEAISTMLSLSSFHRLSRLHLYDKKRRRKRKRKSLLDTDPVLLGHIIRCVFSMARLT